ncbi:hypothetical protein CsSME_00011656 [Camellia sinensis var. sinensis]
MYMRMRVSTGEYKMAFIFPEVQLCISSTMTWSLYKVLRRTLL